MKKGTVLVLWIILFIIAVAVIVFFQDYDKPVGVIERDDGSMDKLGAALANIVILVFVLLVFSGVSWSLGVDSGEKSKEGKALGRIPPGRYKKILVQEECAEKDEHKYWYFFRLMDKDTGKRICCFIPKNEIANEAEVIISKSEIPDHFEVIVRRHQDEKADSKTLSGKMYILKPIIGKE